MLYFERCVFTFKLSTISLVENFALRPNGLRSEGRGIGLRVLLPLDVAGTRRQSHRFRNHCGRHVPTNCASTATRLREGSLVVHVTGKWAQWSTEYPLGSSRGARASNNDKLWTPKNINDSLEMYKKKKENLKIFFEVYNWGVYGGVYHAEIPTVQWIFPWDIRIWEGPPDMSWFQLKFHICSRNYIFFIAFTVLYAFCRKE